MKQTTETNSKMDYQQEESLNNTYSEREVPHESFQKCEDGSFQEKKTSNDNDRQVPYEDCYRTGMFPPLNDWQIAAIIVLLLLIIVALCFFAWCFWPRRQRTQDDELYLFEYDSED
jgi:hypothetical protein